MEYGRMKTIKLLITQINNLSRFIEIKCFLTRVFLYFIKMYLEISKYKRIK
ncbi:hypothetical protein C8C85_3309 [Flavobacterium sp. 103]|nr:hypothetical protein C8C85_3309 [Flavobacterium sp. 103]